jgi:tetratricopeptide (TPR) repeat protein
MAGGEGIAAAISKARGQMDAGKEHEEHSHFAQAEKCFLCAIRILTEIGHEEGGCGGLAGKESAESRGHLGHLYTEMGRFKEALEMHRERLRIHRAVGGDRCEGVGLALHGIGVALFRQGQFGAALERFEESHSILLEACQSDNLNIAACLAMMARIHCELGHDDQGMGFFMEALRIERRHTDATGQSYVAATLQSIGLMCNLKAGMHEEAAANFEEALEITRRVHGHDHHRVAELLHCVGMLERDQGRLDEALKMHKKAVEMERHAVGGDSKHLALGLTLTGQIYIELRKHREALMVLEEALMLFTRALGTDDNQVANSHYHVALCMYDQNDIEGCIGHIAEAVRIFGKLGTSDKVAEAAARFLSYLHEGRRECE